MSLKCPKHNLYGSCPGRDYPREIPLSTLGYPLDVPVLLGIATERRKIKNVMRSIHFLAYEFSKSHTFCNQILRFFKQTILMNTQFWIIIAEAVK